MADYDPKKIEKKWQLAWHRRQLHRAKDVSRKKKYYCLVEFPYPSGDGLHVGHIRSYTAMDVIARKRRAEGFETLYPIGWDSFGLPTENYAVKTGIHPKIVTRKNTDTFRRQLKSLGFSFDWKREVDTSSPAYYKWTQWIFLQMFKRGLAYKAKMAINWCPSCKIGLANEEVIDGRCERCGGLTEKREKEQWMIAITKYADRLLKDLDSVNYLERIKTQQRNWIGRSDGAEIDFPISEGGEKPNFLLLHGWTGRANKNFLPWLKKKLESEGFAVETPELPNTDKPTEEEQVTYVLKNCTIDANTIIVGHSLGAIVALKVLMRHNKPVRGLVLVAAAMDPDTNKEYKPFHKTFSWDFDFEKIKRLASSRLVISDLLETERIPYLKRMALKLEAPIAQATAKKEHFTAKEEPFLLQKLIPSISVFTTRPDTLFGATYLVLAPEHQIIEKLKRKIKNWPEVLKYIKASKAKKEMERMAEGREKTGVALSGVRAINPATKESITVFIADYVLAGYGTGAIMAVPAHDQRDFEFAKEFKLPIREAIEPLFNADDKGEDAIRKGLPFKERHAAVCIVKHWSEDKYIGLKWKKTDWRGFVVGGIEDGESLEDAGRREIAEETGYKNAKFVKKLGGIIHSQFYHPLKNENRWAKFQGLYFELENGEREEISAEENAIHEVLWLTRDEVEKFLNARDMRHFWQRLLRGDVVYTDKGIVANSGKFTGIPSEKAKLEIVKAVGGVEKVSYKLRDWVFSRQRYWGEPIPIIHCENCGTVAVPLKDLPVKLPDVKNFKPTESGESPLANVSTWINVKCPECGGKAKRETDVMPNWAGSSWYYLRYVDPQNKKKLADRKKLNHWMPVDWYNGGMEHTTLHLLYSRFWHKFLFDIGAVPGSEPYAKRTAHGLILAEGGEKMSKSKGNVVNPDDIIKMYGADTLRVYEMFMGPFDQAISWSSDSIIGARRFIEKVWKLSGKVAKKTPADRELESLVTTAVKKVGDDIEEMKFNTAVSHMMILVNEMDKRESIDVENYKTLLQLVAPFAPHAVEELWRIMKGKKSVHEAKWPRYDPKKVAKIAHRIIIQINGKLRDSIMVEADEAEQAEVVKKALARDTVRQWTEGKEVKRVIYVPKRLLNIVV